MEAAVFSYAVIIISLIFIPLFHFLYTLKPTDDDNTASQLSQPGLPPGSKGLPLVGESLHFLSCLKSGNAEKFFLDRIARHSSYVFRTSLLGDTFVVMCGSKATKFLLSNDNRLFRSWWPKSIHMLFSSTLQESFKLKNLAAMFVKPGGLKTYVGVMDYIARRHIHSQWEGRDQVTVLPLAKRYTFTLACKLFLSIEEDELIAKLEAPTSTLALGMFSLPVNLPGTPLNRAIKAAGEVKKLLVQIASRRRMQLFVDPDQADHDHIQTVTAAADDNKDSHGIEDLLTHLLLTTYDGGRRMTDIQIADRIMGILVAAHDTASTVISLTLKYLAEHPIIYDAVFKENEKLAAKKAHEALLSWEDIQEMKYTWNVVREVMRLYPPAQGLFRQATTDFTYAGYRIPKGSKVYLSVNVTHKDSRSFEEPGKFNPSRFEGEGPGQYMYVPFGGGANVCPGRNYAQLEILVFIHNVVKKFRWEMLERNEKIVAYPMPKPANGLPIRLCPHQL